ncbi:hypothetical protein [Hymenobacter sp. B1770]|uniref:hypothetical protein n=1 Tax=Hymenobacter sp. B1770 TaxID=1718788 RepID=UPI003CEE811E
MMLSRTVVWLLVLLWFGWSNPGYAQQAPLPAAPGVSRPLLTAADTVAALQDLFQAKRKSSGWFLAATPVALGVSVAGTGLVAISQLSGTGTSSAIPALMVLGAGIIGTVSVLSRYTRYTKGSEEDVLSRYQRTRRLPGWVARNLAQHRVVKP